MTNTDLSTLCSDLLLQWESDNKAFSDSMDEHGDTTLEDFLHKNLNPEAKVYIYERSCPFMSKETLDAYFGNVAFVQHTQTLQKNTFNVRLIANCDEYKMTHLISYYDGFQTSGSSTVCPSSVILRIGMLKYFFADSFDPFQETMKRILAMKPTKKWMKKALNQNPADVKKQEDLVFAFAKGQLIAII